MSVNKMYEFVKENTEGLYAIYEDYLIRLVGEHGLHMLQANHLIESCGVINGRQMWALVKKGPNSGLFY